jgi:hypothetical protein
MEKADRTGESLAGLPCSGRARKATLCLPARMGLRQRRKMDSGRRIEAPDSPRRALYIGDLLSAQLSPESQLEFFDWGIRLQMRTLFGRPRDFYEIRYEELTEAGLIGKMVRRGIRFRAEFLPQPFIFLTVDGREILDRLEQRGVTVNRNITSLAAELPPRRAAAVHPRLRIPLRILAALWALSLMTVFVLTLIGTQTNFHTLRSDLAKVHLPSGYRLAAQHQAGTDCHQSCSLTQIWTWAPSHWRTPSAACSDVNHAMTAALPDVSPDSSIPATAACAYFTVLDSPFHPAQGKRLVIATVQTGKAPTSGGFIVKLVASYG